MAPSPLPPEDELLGRIAVERGFLSEDLLATCRTEAEAAAGRGRAVPFEKVLVARGGLRGTDLGPLLAERSWRTSSAVAARYRIDGVLGAGATAVVYRAFDTELGRPVALKTIAGGGPGLEGRFRREARALAGLRHPNVGRLFEAGEDGGRLYLVMELVEGRTFRDLLAEGSPDRRRRIEILAAVARGVQAAHEKGIVHRDLKPGNVVVGPGDVPKLIDFGLVRVEGAPSDLTADGVPIGTPLYMSPEQVRGSGPEVRSASDVHALGTMLYEALVGASPYAGRTRDEVYARILRGRVAPPRSIDRTVPAPLDALAIAALAKDPRERPRSAGAFADALEDWLAGRTRSGRGRSRAVLAGAAGVLLLAAAGIALHRPGPLPPGEPVADDVPAPPADGPGPSPAVEAGALEPATSRTPALAEWQGLRYGMSAHFGMRTFTAQAESGREPAELYAPTALDVRQWIAVAKRAGMNYALLTVKHVDGYCLWDSEGWDYDVGSSTSDRTDVVAEFVAACLDEGLWPGLIYCVLDAHVEGGYDKTALVTEDHFRWIERHLTELHTRNRGVREQWIHVSQKLTPEQRWSLYRLVKRLAPDCLVVMNGGFYDGTSIGPVCWPTDILEGEQTWPPARHEPARTWEGTRWYLPMEVSVGMTRSWFHLPGEPTRPIPELFDKYRRAVDRGANFLLGVAVAPSGRIADATVDRLLELRAAVEDPGRIGTGLTLSSFRQVSTSSVLAGDEFLPRFAVDEDPSTRWSADPADRQAWIEVDLGIVRTFDRVSLAEAPPARVRSFQLLAKLEGEWRSVARGDGIGEGAAIDFEPATSRWIRLQFDATEGPSIADLRVYPASG